MGSVFEFDTLVYSGFMLPTRKDHYGIDLHPINSKGVKVENAKILASSNQKVVFAGWTTQGWGNLVKTEDKDYYYYYAHNAKILVKTGETIKEGQPIAIIGSTGNSTGIHLHFEIRKKSNDTRPNGCVDPSKFCGVKNINGSIYKPTKTGDPIYKMRLYKYSGELMSVKQFYQEKEKTPLEIIGIGNKDDKIMIARVIEASETPYNYGKNIPENCYLY